MPRNIIDFAQEYYRSPADHEEMVDSSVSIPPEISNMLDILSGDAHPGDESTRLTADSRKAVLFTLEKIIFSSGGNYYRVLGLAPDATIDQIRKHYDQLQRIFFREDNLDKWNNDYALRINQAYRYLRDPEKRRIYDESLRHHVSPMPRSATGESRNPDHENHNSGSFIANSVHRAYSNHADQQTTSGKPSLRNNDEISSGHSDDEFPTGIPNHDDIYHSKRPSFAFLKDKLSLALLAGVIIMVSLYVILLPPVVRDIQTAGSDNIPDTATAKLAASDLEPVIRHPPPEDAPTPPMLQASPAPIEPEVPITDTSMSDELSEDAADSDAAPAISLATTSPAEPEPEPEPEPRATTMSAPVAPAAPGPALPPAPVIDIAPARRVATSQELDTLTSTFSHAYTSGDLDLMLGLFTEDARTNERSDRAGIRLDYQELFDATESREFIIKDMRWQQGRDGGVSGEGNFQVNIRFRDDGSENSVTGNIVLHIEKRPQGARITQLLHSYH